MSCKSLACVWTHWVRDFVQNTARGNTVKKFRMNSYPFTSSTFPFPQNTQDLVCEVLRMKCKSFGRKELLHLEPFLFSYLLICNTKKIPLVCRVWYNWVSLGNTFTAVRKCSALNLLTSWNWLCPPAVIHIPDHSGNVYPQWILRNGHLRSSTWYFWKTSLTSHWPFKITGMF